jgi:ssDNA-binding Zn-finger/Zn-ribbon topoisomerase 1
VAQMFLCAGIDNNDNLIYIDQVRRGKTNLKCPYCGGFLTAKKGKKKEPHFAHTGESCQAVSESNNLYLPLFDSFTLNLTREEFKQLRKYYYQKKGISKTIFTRLIEKGILNFGGNFCSITKLGKIVFGELSLPLFAEIQDELILKKLDQLEKNATLAYENNSIDFPDLLADFQKYKAQFKRVLNQTLYFMRLKLDGNEYYKIGTVQFISVEDVKKNIEEKTEKYLTG